MEKDNIQLTKQIKSIEDLSDEALLKKLPSLRSEAMVGLIPHLLDRWRKTENQSLRTDLFQFFLDTKRQEELPHFMTAINRSDYSDVRNELLSIFWQSSLDLTEYLEDLIEIGLAGDYMTLIEVATIIETFEEEFEEDQIMNFIYQIEEIIDSEEDEERIKLLSNLRQVISELSLI